MSAEFPKETRSHTPGPWHQFPSNNLCIEAKDGNVALCNLARANDADATLIAAAPELAAALKRSLDWLSSYPGGTCKVAYMNAVAALKKAGCYE